MSNIMHMHMHAQSHTHTHRLYCNPSSIKLMISVILVFVLCRQEEILVAYCHHTF